MFCKKCGKEMKDGWKVCPNCGTTVEGGTEEVIETNNVKEKGEKPKKAKKPIFKKWWFWVIIIIAIAVIGSMMGSDDSDSSNSNPKSEVTSTEGEPEGIDETAENENENIDSPLEIYMSVSDNDVIPYVVNEKAAEFLKTHTDYFPSNNYNQIAGEVDSSIEYKHVEKNSEQYGNKLMELAELYVMSISETDLEDGKAFTEVETTDGDSFYYIIYIGELADIFKGDTIKADGLPLSISSYENTSGGSTTTLVMAGAYIEKISSGDEY